MAENPNSRVSERSESLINLSNKHPTHMDDSIVEKTFRMLRVDVRKFFIAIGCM